MSDVRVLDAQTNESEFTRRLFSDRFFSRDSSFYATVFYAAEPEKRPFSNVHRTTVVEEAPGSRLNDSVTTISRDVFREGPRGVWNPGGKILEAMHFVIFV